MIGMVKAEAERQRKKAEEAMKKLEEEMKRLGADCPHGYQCGQANTPPLTRACGKLA